jgi:hypothetical protein
MLLAVALNNTVQLWETTTWRRQAPLTGFTAQVHRLAFAPDGKRLAVGDHGGTVSLWDVAERRLVAGRRAHATTVEAVAFSPNGRRLASTGYENTVKLWDVALMQEVGALSGHEGDITSVAYSPDGDGLASAGADATVRLWRAPPSRDESLRKAREKPVPSPPVEVIHRFGLEVMPSRIRATHTVTDQFDCVEVTAAGEHDHDAVFGQIFDDLEDGATYTVRFRARADSPRRIRLYGQVGQPDWHAIGLDQAFELTSEWRPYSCSFQAKDVWASNKMNFMLGDQAGTIWIADFTVTRQANAHPAEPEIPR